MTEHVIKIEGGEASFVYDDALVNEADGPSLLAMGPSTVTRASHVEPHPTRPGWLADMSPSGGPVLAANGAACRFQSDNGCAVCATHRIILVNDVHGWKCCATGVYFPHGVPMGSWQLDAAEPFPLREDALAAERAWLREHRGL